MICTHTSMERFARKLFFLGVLPAVLAWQISTPRGLAEHSFEEGKLVYVKYAFIDKEGKRVFNAPPGYDCKDFSDGLLEIKEDKSTVATESYYLDTEGKPIAKGLKRGHSFSEGLAQVREINKTGFIDKSGAFEIEPKFND